MALFRYLQYTSKDNLPDPMGSLSSYIPSQAISQANTEVMKAVEVQKLKTKQGPYHNYIIIIIIIDYCISNIHLSSVY